MSQSTFLQVITGVIALIGLLIAVGTVVWRPVTNPPKVKLAIITVGITLGIVLLLVGGSAFIYLRVTNVTDSCLSTSADTFVGGAMNSGSDTALVCFQPTRRIH